MSLNLLKLLSNFDGTKDRENGIAYLRTRLPDSDDYLNIVYKPAPPHVLEEFVSRWRVPLPVADFLAIQNGANLFSNSLSIFGVVPPGTQLNRTDPHSLPPFNIEDENNHWQPADPDRLLVIGAYSLNGARICIDRSTLRVPLFELGDTGLRKTPTLSWNTVVDWLSREVDRMSLLFDKNGKRLANEGETIPKLNSIH